MRELRAENRSRRRASRARRAPWSASGHGVGMKALREVPWRDRCPVLRQSSILRPNRLQVPRPTLPRRWGQAPMGEWQTVYPPRRIRVQWLSGHARCYPRMNPRIPGSERIARAASSADGEPGSHACWPDGGGYRTRTRFAIREGATPPTRSDPSHPPLPRNSGRIFGRLVEAEKFSETPTLRLLAFSPVPLFAACESPSITPRPSLLDRGARRRQAIARLQRSPVSGSRLSYPSYPQRLSPRP